MQHVTVCICTRNRWATIAATLHSLAASTSADFDVVIVDQSTNDETARAVQAATAGDGRFSYLRSETVGLSAARNVAMTRARGPIVAFTDDDCEVQADWLAVLAACFEVEPEVGVISGAVIAPKRARRFLATCPAFDPAEALYDPVSSGRQPPAGWDWLCANVAFRLSVMQRAGQFDEYLGAGAIFPAAEDTDYKLRLEAMGIKMRSTPRAVVYHTYGYRYGLRAVLRHIRSYARGNAGLGGKLTLSGDSRGQEWLAMTKRECTANWARQLRRGKLPASLLRLWYYTRAYQECLRSYRVDPKSGFLSPVEQAQQRLSGAQTYHL